jgi:hypothetical protein
MMPLRPKRLRSAESTTCACSTRHRRSPVKRGLSASIALSSCALAASPIACTATCMPSAAAASICARSCASVRKPRPALARRVQIIVLQPRAARASAPSE